MIDLRSDTVTRPSEAMRRAMSAADVGDDVYGEDATVMALEERLGRPAGLRGGTLSRSPARRYVCWPFAGLVSGCGEEVLCESSAHIARAEMGAHGSITGLTMRTWTHPQGHLDLPAVESLRAPDLGPFFVRTSCVSVENTHNFAGGRVQPVESLRALRAFADASGIAVHLDGARIWNAHVASGGSHWPPFRGG